MIADRLKSIFVKAIKPLKRDIRANDITLEHPQNLDHGDYATNIALKLTKELKQNPMQIAQNIINTIDNSTIIDTVSVAKPGFINIRISSAVLIEELQKQATNKFDIPPYHLGKERKIMIEFAHPNTLKLFHIGHLRNITTGESIVRILQATGNDIIRANYQGDVGLHIAKTLWKIKQTIDTPEYKIMKDAPIVKRIDYIGKMYAAGNKAYEEDEDAKKQIIEINKQIFRMDPAIEPLWKETRQWSLEYFESVYKRVYSTFDAYYFESQMSQKGKQIVLDGVKKGIFEESQGAIVLPGEPHGIHTRVYVNSIGLPTYEGKEMGLAFKEFTEHGTLDKCIHVVGGEQTSYFQSVFKALQLLDPDLFKDKQFHLVYGWVDLKGAKMSSRKGNVIEGEWLLDRAKKEITAQFPSTTPETAEVLAVAAVKYGFLKNGLDTKVVFDINEAIDIHGNSGPYILYTYVRTQSILNKAGNGNTETVSFADATTEEITLLRTMYRYPEVIYAAARSYSPNLIANFLFQTAQNYNTMYQKLPILKSTKDEQARRLLLTKAVAYTISHGLDLLGIKTVEEM